mmetsp:Transcript_13939/g.31586  ORF Transcript_13939/g.31586 Transcript_13939/m.31586 type:complete len:271 (-) Transcript_13939:13-825(-)
MMQVSRHGRARGGARLSLRAQLLVQLQAELSGALREAAEDRRQLEAVLEDREAPEDVEAEPRTAHRDDESPHVAKVADVVGPNERDDDEVVLLTLEPVDRGNLVRLAEQWVPSAALPNDVADQRLLPVVRGQDGDLGSWVSHQPHVHEEGHAVLCLAQVLVEVRRGLGLALPVEVLHVYELVVIGEARVGIPVPALREDVREVAEVLVPPTVQVRDVGPGAALQVQIRSRRPQSHKAGVQGLVQVPVLLEGTVLDHGWQLVVVADEHDPL